MSFVSDADGEAGPGRDGYAAALLDGAAVADRVLPLGGRPQPYPVLDGHQDGHGTERELIDLRRRLASLPQIEQAKGMLMGLYGIDADTAFAVLRRWSSNSNVKLRDLAGGLVAAGTRAHPQPYGALLEHLRECGLR